ncbi:hypothetical protein SBA6_300015 [Candidatus Sulfopaludibacter sp. SbA6]|nr:hypothetical protein SBA6_300015 [Candidatus Sulfopaludibacter sp. SbA6]
MTLSSAYRRSAVVGPRREALGKVCSLVRRRMCRASPRRLRAAWSGCCHWTIRCLSRSPRAILRLGIGIMLFMATADKADLSRITIVPGQRSGQPCIRGLRITAWDVLDMLASEMTEDEILRDLPLPGEGRFSGSLCLRHAGANGFTSVTADSDLLDLARSRGVPPQGSPA